MGTPPLFAAAVLPDRATLRSAEELPAAAQGSYDGLCGLYAIINALRLLLAAHGGSGAVNACALFQRGVTLLAKQEALVAAVGSGMELTRWRPLLLALVDETARTARVPIAVLTPFRKHPPRSRDELFEAIHRGVRQQRPVLGLLVGDHEHYTVVAGYTPTRLILHDSHGYRWLDKCSCGWGREATRYRNRFATTSLSILGLG